MVTKRNSTETAVNLNQIGLYSPQRQNAEITEKLFAIHKQQFEWLLSRLEQESENSAPQHYLIVGQRGMGKTMILKRIDVELHKDEYRQRFIPLLFPEKQYNVADLTELWFSCLEALADTLVAENYSAVIIADIDKIIDSFRNDLDKQQKKMEQVRREAYRFFVTLCRKLQRRPVLLIDNIDMLLNRFITYEKHMLRSFLSESGAPVLIGSGSVTPDDTNDYTKPFYDFFKIQYLEKLNIEESMEILNNLATVTCCNEAVFTSIQKNIPRQKALLELTGGNSRITAMLFRLIIKGFSGNINDDLEALADEMTPLYKSKYEQLSDHQQQILSAIAMNKDAASLKKLSMVTRMKNTQLVPHLKHLMENGWIEATISFRAKGNVYTVSDRFFGIWFLLRQGNRRYKQAIFCLSEFLEYFYDKEPERLSNSLRQDISASAQMLLSMALSNTTKKARRKKQIDEQVYNAFKNNENLSDELENREYSAADEKHLAFLTKKSESMVWYNKGITLVVESQHYEEAVKCFEKVVELNPLNENGWLWKGICMFEMQNYEEALVYLDKSITLNPENEYAWFYQAECLLDLKKYNDALNSYDKAIEINPDYQKAWNSKGYTLTELQWYREAASAYEKSNLINSSDLLPKLHLLFLYRDKLYKMHEARVLFKSIDENRVNRNENENMTCRFYLHKAVFELYSQNQDAARISLLQAFGVLEKANKLLTMANTYWFQKFGSVVSKLNYGAWLLGILEEKGFDTVLSPYYTAIQALEVEKQKKSGKSRIKVNITRSGKVNAEIYLKNRAAEISDPARIIIEKMHKWMD